MRAEEAFRGGNVPDLIEATAERTCVLQGKKWTDRERFLASLSLEVDRTVLEPNEALQASLVRMFAAEPGKAVSSQLTVSFQIRPETGPAKPLVIGEQVPIGAVNTNATQKLRLFDGRYTLTATIAAGNEILIEINRRLYSISDFSDRITELNASIARLKERKPGAILAATPEFQTRRLASFIRTGVDGGIDAITELERIEAAVSAIAKGSNPFEAQRGEVERAYRAADDALVPYRLYIPRSYSPAGSAPLLVLLHGALGDERSYLSDLYDSAAIKGEAEKRGYILATPNARGRFSNYRGPGAEDVSEVIKAVMRDYKIDENRVYLSGHSLGAFGTWLIAADNPRMFAAVAPVSGGSPVHPSELPALLEKLTAVPAMIVHGAKDGIVPPDRSRSMYNAARKAGMKVIYLEVPEADHVGVVAATVSAVMDFFDKQTKGAASR